MAYEVFTRNVIRVEAPAIAIAPQGRIALNAASTRTFEAAGVKAVRILWDKAKCGIALVAAQKGAPDSFSVAYSPGRSASVTARSFLRFIGWSAKKRQSVFAKWNSELGMLEAELPREFVREAAPATAANPDQKQAAGMRFHSPGASGNIRNWMTLNEPAQKK